MRIFFGTVNPCLKMTKTREQLLFLFSNALLTGVGSYIANADYRAHCSALKSIAIIFDKRKILELRQVEREHVGELVKLKVGCN